MKVKISKWDTAEELKTEEEMAAYLQIVMEEGTPEEIALAVGNVARAKGMTEIAKETGLTRESLYHSLSKKGNPLFSTVKKVINALNLQISVKPLAV
jgi:probable addiction module antidote protein